MNAMGCVAMGLLMGVGRRQGGGLSETAQLVIAVGFLGVLTTFSSFGYDTLTYLEQQRWGTALVNVAANVVLGVGGCALGNWLAALALGK